jgi:hypothetical protein
MDFMATSIASLEKDVTGHHKDSQSISNTIARLRKYINIECLSHNSK